MNLIDTSFWFEFYVESNYSKFIEEVIKQTTQLIIPTITIVEMYKKLINVTDEGNALRFIAQMKKGKIVDLDFDLSLSTAYYGKLYKLPLADSIIYATAMKFNATIYTLDKHFKGLPNVQYFEKL